MRWLTGLLASAALAVGVVVVHQSIPADDREVSPITTSGRVGEKVDARGFAIDVHRVLVTKTLVPADEFSSRPPAKTADGIWVVVDATLTGDWKATNYNNAQLESAGEIFHASIRPDPDALLNQDDATDPGLPRRGAIVFEIPPERLASSSVRISKSGPGETRLGPEALIDLGLDDAKAAELIRRAPAKLTLKPVEYAR